MSWVLFFISVGITIIGVLYGDRVGNSEERKLRRTKRIDRIKRNSKAIHFTFDECTFTNLEEAKKISGSTSLGIQRKNIHKEIKSSKSQISCRKSDTEKEYVGVFSIDVKTAKIRTHHNNGIIVYTDKEDIYTRFEEDEYYMDLDFLESYEANTIT